MLLPLLQNNLLTTGGRLNYTASGLAGAYTVTGQTATVNFRRNAAGSNGTYTVTGQTAVVAFGRKAAGSAGSYTVTGQTATTLFARNAAGSAGSYTVTGQAAIVAFGRNAAGTNGTYTVTGQGATATYTPGSGAIAYTAQGSAGAYVVTGQSAQAVYTNNGPTVTNGAGFARLDRGHYKYKYRLKDEELQALETAAKQRIETKTLTTLHKTLERLGVVYHDAYKRAFTEILAQLRAEQAAQDAEDEQIAQIIAALL